jgi:hypothetical protein
MTFIHDLEAAEAFEASRDQLPAEREIPDAADVAFDILAEAMLGARIDVGDFSAPPCKCGSECEACHPF